MLVLHLVGREPTYGNRLIESIEEITHGAMWRPASTYSIAT